MSKDYYKTLGIEKSASKDDIKKAFRKLAHEHHPDKSGGDDKKFKEISEAYATLSDDNKRAQYDQFGSGFSGASGAGQGGQGGFSGAGGFGNDFGGFDFSRFQQGQGVEFDLNDLFGGIFGGQGGGRRSRSQGQKRGSDISVDVELPFKDSIFGADRTISITKNSICKHCKGGRAEPGTEMKTCPACQGSGQITETRRSILGNFQSVRTCDQCLGTGKVPKEKCKVCRGAGITREREDITVKIPPGMENGETLRVMGKGEAVAGGITGDLYIRVHVKAHQTFTKEGQNLVMTLPVRLSDALIGCECEIEILEGKLTIKIPAGITFGEILRVREKGVPIGGGKRGDLLIKVIINLPKKLSKEAKKLIEDLKREGI